MPPRRTWPFGLALSWGLLACSEPDAEAPTESTSAGGDTGTTTSAPYDSSPSDRCAVAPIVGAGRHLGTLRDKLSDRGGACGRGGPDAFVVLDVPRRADVRVEARGVGFAPIVGVRPSRCELDWSTELLCTQGLEGWVLDAPAGGTLLVSVGIGSDDPALGTSPEPGQSDPLDFVLDVSLRTVLLEGESCSPPSRGRCVSGTACLSADDGWGTTGEVSEAEPPRCVTIAGDTCATAWPLSLERGSTVITLDSDAAHTDAHAHTCGGLRRPERVLALALPVALEPGAHLEARTEAPDVALALRGPGCTTAEELACAPASEHGSVAVVEDLLALGSHDVFLFVELPRRAQADDGTGTAGYDASGTAETGELPPLVVEVELWGG